MGRSSEFWYEKYYNPRTVFNFVHTTMDKALNALIANRYPNQQLKTIKLTHENKICIQFDNGDRPQFSGQVNFQSKILILYLINILLIKFNKIF